MATDLDNRPETDTGSDASNPGQKHYDDVFNELTSKEHLAKDGESGAGAGADGDEGGLYNSGGEPSVGSKTTGSHSAEEGESAGGVRGLYNKGKDGRSRLRNRVSKFKKKWVIAAAFGGGGLGMLVLLLVLLVGTLKIPHLAENITAYQFARVTQQMSRNTSRVLSDKISVDSAKKAVYDKLEQRYATVGKAKEAWAKLDKFRPNKVISNMQSSGQASLEYKPDKFGRPVLAGIQLTDRSIPVSNTNTLTKLIPGFKLARDVKFSTDVAPRLNTAIKANAWGPIIRGRVAKQIRKELGVSLIAWKVGEFKGKNAEKARILVEQQAHEKISGNTKDSVKTQPLKDSANAAVEAEEKAVANETSLKRIIKNGGKIQEVKDSITKSLKESPYITSLKFINGFYGMAVPVCIVYEGSVEHSGPTINQQSEAQQKAYYLVASAADEQKDGTNGSAEATGAFNEKLGDINGSIPMQRASGASVDTTGYMSTEAGAGGGTFSLANALFGQGAAVSFINWAGDNLCPKLTDTKIATAVGAANIVAIFLSGGGAAGAEGAAQKAATTALGKVAEKIAATVIRKKGAVNVSGKIGDILTDTTKSAAKIAGATILAKLIVMSKSGYTNNGLEQGKDFAAMADSGGNIAGNELDRKQFYGRPLTKDEAAVSAGQTMAFVNEQNASKSTFQRYFALSNPQSLLTRFATTSATLISNAKAPSLLKQLGNLLDPTTLFSSLFSHLNPQTVHASAAQDAVMLNYGNVQFGFSSKEQSVMDTDPTYGLLENRRLLDESGKEDDIESDYGKCFTESLGDLISGGDIVLDDNNNVKDNEGDCAPAKLTLGSAKYGDMVFRWRVAHSYDGTLDQLDDMQTITESATTATQDTNVNIATFNILGASHTPTWRDRADRSLNVITSNNLDVIGLQEFQNTQRDYFYAQLNKSSSYGIFPSAKAKDKNHDVVNSIMWNSDKFDLVASYTQPNLGYFCFKQMDAPYVKLRSKDTGQEFYVLNTHDPAGAKGNPCRKDAAKHRYMDALEHVKLVQKLQAEGLPIYFTGDFNSRYTDKISGNGPYQGKAENLTYCILAVNGPLLDAYDVFSGRKATCPNETPPGGGGGIDHVYISPEIKVTNYATAAGGTNGSDHPTIIFNTTIPGSDSSGAGIPDFSLATWNLPGSHKSGYSSSQEQWKLAASSIKQNNVDILGFQEFSTGNFQYMKQNLTNYGSYPTSYPKTKGYHRPCMATQPIFYNESTFNFVKGAYFSFPRYNDPAVDCGNGEQASAGMTDAPIVWLESVATGQEIIVINTHNVATLGNAKSAGAAKNRYLANKIFVQQIQRLKTENPGTPIFLTGDFNEGTNVRTTRNVTYQGNRNNLLFCMFAQNGLMKSADGPAACNPSNSIGGVDYVYVPVDVTVKSTKHITRKANGSDHPYALLAHLEVPSTGTSAGGSKSDGTDTSSGTTSVPKLATLRNFRDAGASSGTIRPKMLLRSARLSELSTADAKTLGTYLGNKATIINFLPAGSVSGNDKTVPGVTDIRHPIIGTLNYRNFVDRANDRKQFASTIRLIANADGPVLIHCYSGKDRTGWLVAMVMSAVGASNEQIMQEYLLSNNKGVGEVKEAWLNAGFDEARRKYGSVHDYLVDGLGLDKAVLKKLSLKLGN
ncbi:hypothetical protein BH09PAT4_BH09PAT4_03280 [soil metagenome]